MLVVDPLACRCRFPDCSVCALPLAAVASGSGGKTSDDPTNAEQTLVEDKVGTDSDEHDQVRLSADVCIGEEVLDQAQVCSTDTNDPEMQIVPKWSRVERHERSPNEESTDTRKVLTPKRSQQIQ